MTTTAVAPLLLTVPQAAQALALSRSAVYRLIDRGEITAVHSGRAVRIPYSALQSYVEQLLEAS